MADRLTNIELLVLMTEDLKNQGDELTVEINSRGAAHARRVVELLAMLEKAHHLLEREKQRFEVYLPRQHEQQAIPRVVAKGPARAAE